MLEGASGFDSAVAFETPLYADTVADRDSWDENYAFLKEFHIGRQIVAMW
jgi:hypothetical protein